MDNIQRIVQGVLRFIRQLFGDPQTAVGTTIVLLFLFLAFFGNALAPYGANETGDIPVSAAPSTQHPFGTDTLGRDVFSRVMIGTSSIFQKAGLGTLLAVLIGTVIGLYIGYQGGWIDEATSRVIDALLAMPALLLALVILGVIRNLSLEQGSLQFLLARNSVLLVIAVVYVPIVARVVRSSTLEIKTREFVQAARIRGESLGYILFREIFPSVVPTLVVEASLRFSYAIFLVAALGFLGIGANPPTPDWGLMVEEARGGNYNIAPWALNFPAAAIALLVVGVNLMSDGIKNIVQKSE
ncbi:MAG: ABC transporter permease [Chloroflexi bacterium]|nr:ABC transporter permease [Chloroflexota bacterium]